MGHDADHAPHLEALLERHLRAFLGDVDASVIALFREQLDWQELGGGETLMRQGDVGDAMYIVLSGRLRVQVSDSDGGSRVISEIARGEVVGEMSLFTDEPRLATVTAVRDSVLVKLPKSRFRQLIEGSAQVSIALTRLIIRRLQDPQHQPALEKPVVIGLMPITDGVNADYIVDELALELAKIGRVQVVDADMVDEELGVPGLADSGAHDVDVNRRIAMLLDAVEARADYVLLQTDPALGVWTERCCRHCDELLLLADATQPVAVHPLEQKLLANRAPGDGAAEILVLLHEEGVQMPRNTAAWLARRPLAGHLHLRPTLAADIARLARIESRSAIGLVLAGGGARGIAHLGVLEALDELGIPVDCTVGSSIGAVMAVYAASDQYLPAVFANARRAFRGNPIGDFNLLPLLSLSKGKRLRRVLTRATRNLMGGDHDLEDLWKTCYCIATNYSKAREQTLASGNIVECLLASTSIPGALPPVIRDHDLLFDGGTFNNFPVDVLRRMRGVGTVIGVDLGYRNPRRITHDDVPGTWALLRDRLRPRAKRRYRLPSLPAYLMNVSVLYSTARQRGAERLCDIYLNPPLLRIGMLDWHEFDRIVRLGHAHAIEALTANETAQALRVPESPDADSVDEYEDDEEFTDPLLKDVLNQLEAMERK